MAEWCRIGVVAPANPIRPDLVDDIERLARAAFGDSAPSLTFHPQCFLGHKHFAGTDAERLRAFREFADEPKLDAVWFARGGYGSNRIAVEAAAGLSPVARAKRYLGYSDGGFLLAALHRAGCPGAAHGPMPQDLRRSGGDAAVLRGLRWLASGDPESLEPSLVDGRPAAAFNLTVLSQLLGTPLEPDLTGRVLMLEEVSEHMYRIDRAFFHVTSNPRIRRVAGIRLGRCSDVLPNEPDFGMNAEEIARHWCEVAGIPFLGAADIGHDVCNRVVPFGPSAKTTRAVSGREER